MTTCPDDLSRRLAAIAKQELQAILRSTGEVDAAFFYGRRLSVRWVSERARAAAAGMRRACARISQEIPAVCTHEVARAAAKAEECLGRLAESLVGAHRHSLMASVASRIPTVVSTSCGRLSSELSRERLYAVEAIYRSPNRRDGPCNQPSM
jgi:hypothetical protein